jgi:hypothetical protein
MPELAWTVDEASAYFAAAGLPFPPRRLLMIIRALGWRPVGATPSGPAGGRGKALYPVRDFQELHRDLAGWLTRIRPEDPG